MRCTTPLSSHIPSASRHSSLGSRLTLSAQLILLLIHEGRGPDLKLTLIAEGLVERTRDRTRRQQRHARVWRPRKSRCAMDLLQLHGEGRDTEKRVMVREERDTANRQLGDDADVFKSRSAYVIAHTSSSRRGSGGLLPFTMVSDCIVYVPASQDQRSGLLLGLYALRKRQGLTTRGE